MSTASTLVIGFVAACVVAGGGYRVRALSVSGTFAAVFVGTAVFGLGGWRWAAVMVGFFILSSALSRIGHRRKRTAEGIVEKGSQRDAIQVLANGGVAALIAIGHGIAPGADILFPAFLGSMAAATADTWSTEIGSFSRTPPRSIFTGKTVPPGMSGGITLLGLAGALAGALIIGLIGGVATTRAINLVFIGAIAGYSGSIVDSALGASVQQMNQCPTCLVLTERAVHDCGSQTVAVRGLPGFDNDVVNVLTTLFGALCGGLLYLVVG